MAGRRRGLCVPVLCFMALIGIGYFSAPERLFKGDYLRLQATKSLEDSINFKPLGFGGDSGILSTSEVISEDDYLYAATEESNLYSDDAVTNFASIREKAVANLTLEVCHRLSRKKEKPGLTKGYPVQYIHIPKAGGTSVQAALAEWAETSKLDRYMKNGHHAENWTCPGNVAQGLLYGHRGFGFCAKMLNRFSETAFYIVSIREPISHFRSLFDYMMSELRDWERPDHKAWSAKPLSELIVEYNKTLSKGFSENDPRLRFANQFRRLAKQQSVYMCGWDCIEYNRDIDDETIRRRALDNLQRTDVVVTMERLNHMVDQLKFHLGWISQDATAFPRKNIAKKHVSRLTPRAIAILTEWSKLDIDLYNAARQKDAELTAIARRCNELIRSNS